MKALVLEAYNKLTVTEVPVPDIGPEEVLVKVKACGICGSDIHGMDGSTGRRIPPLIMGHEASGLVAAVGEGVVASWKVGDRVTFDSTVYPQDDWFTEQGLYNLSDGREVIGVSPGDYKRDGAFAEYVKVPQHILYKIPDNVTFEEAAMVEPVAVALHSIHQVDPERIRSSAVIGVGMIGSFILELLQLKDVNPLIAVDINSANLSRAVDSGVTHAFAPDSELANRVKELTEGRGVDTVFEAVGIQESLVSAFSLVRKGGNIVLVGNLSSSVELPLQKVVTEELKILGSCAIRGEYREVLQLISEKKIDVRKHLSAVAPLSEGAQWFERLRKKDHGLGKVILTP